MAKYVYPAVFELDESSKSYSISFPDVQGAYTSASAVSEGLEMAQDCLALVLAEREKKGEIVKPTPIQKIHLKNEKNFVRLISADTDLY